jgi:hypothetical protein
VCDLADVVPRTINNNKLTRQNIALPPCLGETTTTKQQRNDADNNADNNESLTKMTTTTMAPIEMSKRR